MDHDFIARTRRAAMGCMSSNVHLENGGHHVQSTARACSPLLQCSYQPVCTILPHICKGHKYTTKSILPYHLHLLLIK